MRQPIIRSLILFTWFAFIWLLVWGRISRSEQLPTFDAFEYYHKAKVFWDAIKAGAPFDPFSLQPTLRPPGTVLMSYPFGFSDDPRPFYFRSVALPIAFFSTAIALVSDFKTKWLWPILSAVSATTLPMFYQFESGASPVHYFGLVDVFFAGLTALAAASVIKSVEQSSAVWTLSAAILSAISLTIKPTGLVVIGLIAVTWLLGAALTTVPSRSTREYGLFVLKSVLIFAVIFTAILTESASSGYLSFANIEFGAGAQSLLQKDFGGILSPLDIALRLYMAFGVCFPTAMLLPFITALAVDVGFRSRQKPYVWLISSSCLSMALGLWIWIGTSNFTQLRYLFPFALAAVVFLVPALQAGFQAAPRWAKTAAVFLLIAPSIWTPILLIGQGSPKLEAIVGMAARAGPFDDDDLMADAFFKRLPTGTNTKPIVYTLSVSGPGETALARRFSSQSLLYPERPSISLRNPVNWVSSSTIRIDDIVTSDYLLVYVMDHDETLEAASFGTGADSFKKELNAFRLWGTHLAPRDGVSVVAKTATSILFKINDRAKLTASLLSVKSGYQWRSEFVSANQPVWYDPRTRSFPQKPVSFGDAYLIREATATKQDGTIVVELCWSGSGSSPEKQLFIHVINDRGDIITQTGDDLERKFPSPENGWVRTDVYRIPIPVDGPYRVAIGIYDRGSDFLKSDAVDADWDGHRMLLDLSL